MSPPTHHTLILQDDDKIMSADGLAFVTHVAESCLLQLKLTPCELCLRFVLADEISQLNDQFRQKNKPTNVLSFPYDGPRLEEARILGDIIICRQVVESEAFSQNEPFQAHLAHMVVHGCLHLLGYDHISKEQADIMEPLEIALLAAIDIPNPYSHER